MIGVLLGTRVWIAAGVTDMRNYAERTIMRSPQPARSVFLFVMRGMALSQRRAPSA